MCLLIRKNSLAFGIFFAILAVSGVLNTGKILKEYKTVARSYENMRKEVQSASIDEGGTEAEIDEEKLKKINPDYSFWIRDLREHLLITRLYGEKRKHIIWIMDLTEKNTWAELFLQTVQGSLLFQPIPLFMVTI